MLATDWAPHPCPWCEGWSRGCALCRGTGWLQVRPVPPRRTRDDDDTHEMPAVTEENPSDGQ